MKVFFWAKKYIGVQPAAPLAPPLPDHILPLPAGAVSINRDRSVEGIKKNLACLSGQGRQFGYGYVYMSEEEILRQGGIPLTQNTGVALQPSVDGSGYHLCLCPGGGYGSFTVEQIQGLMDEASRTLARVDFPEVAITGFFKAIGRHPGPTIENFRMWQQANR